MEMKIIDERELFNRNFKIYGTVDEPLFLAKNIAEMIEYDLTSVNKMLKLVDEEEKLNGSIFLAGQIRNVSMVTEDGLYEILMKSDKPIAKELILRFITLSLFAILSHHPFRNMKFMIHSNLIFAVFIYFI